MKAVVAVLLVVVLLAALGKVDAGRTKKQPNFLVLMVDDLGYEGTEEVELLPLLCVFNFWRCCCSWN